MQFSHNFIPVYLVNHMSETNSSISDFITINLAVRQVIY